MTTLTKTTHRLSGGHSIVLQEAGAGPAVVFIHGSGPGASGASNFRQNIEAFVAAGYRVILPDLIGYGASSKPDGIDYTLQLFTDTLLEALDLHGIAEAILVGNSLGGGIAIQAALDRPGLARALVLNPRVMLLDEPLEGLAPIIVEELLAALRRIIREEGMSAILVEQNAKKILGVTDRAIIVERGAVVHAADSAVLAADRAALETHLGVTDQGPRRGGRAKG